MTYKDYEDYFNLSKNFINRCSYLINSNVDYLTFKREYKNDLYNLIRRLKYFDDSEVYLMFK